MGDPFDLYKIYYPEKMCFAYCGDDLCDCAANPNNFLDTTISPLYDDGKIKERPLDETGSTPDDETK